MLPDVRARRPAPPWSIAAALDVRVQVGRESARHGLADDGADYRVHNPIGQTKDVHLPHFCANRQRTKPGRLESIGAGPNLRGEQPCDLVAVHKKRRQRHPILLQVTSPAHVLRVQPGNLPFILPMVGENRVLHRFSSPQIARSHLLVRNGLKKKLRGSRGGIRISVRLRDVALYGKNQGRSLCVSAVQNCLGQNR